MMEGLLYEMTRVEEPSVEVEVRSARGTLSWRHPVSVERLLHEEPLPEGFSPANEANRLAYRERLSRLARGAAAEAFLALTEKTALHAGLDWLMLNVEPADHVFLFSTRKQERLAETLGSEGGVLELGAYAFYVMTDRRVAEDVCFCIRTHNYRVFVRYDLDGAYARVYMSAFVKTGAGRNAVRLNAEEALHYLHALRQGRGGLKLPPIVARMTPPLSEGDALPHVGRPAFPADMRQVLPPRPSEEERRTPPSAEPGESPSRCPACGGELFRLSATDAFCRSCDWSNLPPLKGEGTSL